MIKSKKEKKLNEIQNAVFYADNNSNISVFLNVIILPLDIYAASEWENFWESHNADYEKKIWEFYLLLTKKLAMFN